MRHLLLSAVCVAATDSNATFGALADRVEWTRVNDKASYDWPNSTLRHFAPVEAMDLVRGRHVLVLGNSVARHVVVALHMLIGGRAPDARGIAADTAPAHDVHFGDATAHAVRRPDHPKKREALQARRESIRVRGIRRRGGRGRDAVRRRCGGADRRVHGARPFRGRPATRGDKSISLPRCGAIIRTGNATERVCNREA